MAIFKCKMCGGTLDINNNESVFECEYCGTNQTLPKLDDDKKSDLYDRANHFRRNNEFDKAMGIYEHILNEDKTDAEAYWSLVLCRYGIEYVEDPVSHKRVPTVNRAQYTSIFDDNNYKAALEYADTMQKSIYEEEAKTINEIQKGILEISQKEEPFDVFICYKETDNNGRRTPDSVLANDLYHQLTQEGFKVFFARITLEDKLGSAYEPYIFAALNSAKVMVVLGTKPEFFNAVWVRNEWSRYLALIKNGEKKQLIPAYKDMDPYDLPEEFSHLQAQDMSKLGFMQDLIRGIKKITGENEAVQTVVKETVVQTSGSNAAPLLERAFIFLEDGKWESADEYFEKVLDMEPKNGEAYLGKLMVKIKIKQREELKKKFLESLETTNLSFMSLEEVRANNYVRNPFDSYEDYKKAIRYGNEQLVNELKECTQYAYENAYANAKEKMENAKTPDDYNEASYRFEFLNEYKDSKMLKEKCKETAEKEKKYCEAVETMNKASDDKEFKEAREKLKEIKGYKDSEELRKKCVELQNEMHYLEAVEAMNRATDDITYRIAKEQFEKLRDYKDSDELAGKCEQLAQDKIYFAALECIEGRGISRDSDREVSIEDYKMAIEEFKRVIDWRESKEKIEKCEKNIERLENEEKERLELLEKESKRIAKRNKIIAIVSCAVVAFAIVLFKVIIPTIKYNSAIALIDEGDYVGAYEALSAMDGFKDSEEKMKEIRAKKNLSKMKDIKAGDYITYGAYEQDNDTGNGKEEIEWVVINIKDNKALVISRYALDCKSYNTQYEGTTWGKCSLRSWLNSNFIAEAFTVDERNYICETTVTADKNPDHSTNPGNDTQDEIFLLSINEVEKYFPSDNGRECVATEYAKSCGADTDDSGCCWWLRSPGSNQGNAAYVLRSGGVFGSGDYVDCGDRAVRPALWINLES